MLLIPKKNLWVGKVAVPVASKPFTEPEKWPDPLPESLAIEKWMRRYNVRFTNKSFTKCLPHEIEGTYQYKLSRSGVMFMNFPAWPLNTWEEGFLDPGFSL